MKKVAILHYASPPTVGGVEETIAYHARGLADLGYSVCVVTGKGDSFDSRVETYVNPLFGSLDPRVLKVKAQLDAGQVTPDYEALVAEVRAGLLSAFDGTECCIAHNVATLNKNLPLTAALASLAQTRKIKLIVWCHDLAWTNPEYLKELHNGQPWDLLRQVWPNTRYVTVSEDRRHQLADLLDVSPESISVVVPGVDPHRFFNWTPATDKVAAQFRLLDADGVLLLPARIIRRKNVELALRILSEVRRQSKRDFRLIVSGPPGPHNPDNKSYLDQLLTLRRELGLDDVAHFLYADSGNGTPLIPDEAMMANLYQLSDALLFPSIQEGFGIPVLEAGLTGIPVFCADIPTLRASGQADATYFDPVQEAPEDIATRLLHILDTLPTYRLRVRVRHTYRWEAIIRKQIVPLVEGL